MAMMGLEKITEKILGEAQERADSILAEAEAECARIRAEYAARGEKMREQLVGEAEEAAKNRILRAKSTAATAKRNLLLQTKSELIDLVFDGALEGTLKLSNEHYADLLIGLLCAALTEQLEAEHIGLALYGDEDRIEPEAYEVLMNQRDRDRVGRAVIEGAKKKLGGKADKAKLDRLVLSDKTVSIDGGLILRYGPVESNCSLSLLFAQLREGLEADVSRALFDARTMG